MAYEDHVSRRLGEVLQGSKERQRDLDIDEQRWIIFSDHHKGQRDGADDFLRCERAYNAALGYYLESGHDLLILGDAEELWECRPQRVMKAYGYTLDLEAEFHKQGRYHRFFGNHDSEWESTERAARHLGGRFPQIEVREGASFRVISAGRPLGTLFLAHGHQGTTFSDRHKWIGRFFVWTFWRPIQRTFHIRSTTPARDLALREKHDRAMYAWAAAQEKLVLVAGHTHRPVFLSASHADQVEAELAEARADGEDAKVAELRARLEWIKAQGNQGPQAGRGGGPALRPCYFNTGCCSFADGDITGLEIADGRIRLVRWPDDDGKPRPKELDAVDLAEVFAAL